MEVLKLQKDSIQGVIIDLMDNGGGSMDEAMKLAGMFIDSGPISVILDNKKGANHYKRPLSRNDLQRSDSDIDKREFGFSKRVLLLHCKTTIELMGTGTLGKATIQSIMALEK
jgi:carboxyl-terminal processing protease